MNTFNRPTEEQRKAVEAVRLEIEQKWFELADLGRRAYDAVNPRAVEAHSLTFDDERAFDEAWRPFSDLEDRCMDLQGLFGPAARNAHDLPAPSWYVADTDPTWAFAR